MKENSTWLGFVMLMLAFATGISLGGIITDYKYKYIHESAVNAALDKMEGK